MLEFLDCVFRKVNRACFDHDIQGNSLFFFFRRGDALLWWLTAGSKSALIIFKCFITKFVYSSTKTFSCHQPCLNFDNLNQLK